MSYKFDGSKVFFTSDTHFYHGNIIRFCNRPFKDVEMMNETIIANWNNTIGQDDIVFHLGDLYALTFPHCLNRQPDYLWLQIKNGVRNE